MVWSTNLPFTPSKKQPLTPVFLTCHQTVSTWRVQRSWQRCEGHLTLVEATLWSVTVILCVRVSQKFSLLRIAVLLLVMVQTSAGIKRTLVSQLSLPLWWSLVVVDFVHLSFLHAADQTLWHAMHTVVKWTKSHNPIQNYHPAAARPYLRGNCRSYWCRWRKTPVQILQWLIGLWIFFSGETVTMQTHCWRCLTRIWKVDWLTSGKMGGVRVPFRRPSQLNPSNHLSIKESDFKHCTRNTLFLKLLRVNSLTCASGCPSLRFSGFPASQTDCLCGHKHLQLKMSMLSWSAASWASGLFWYQKILYFEVWVVPEVGYNWCVRRALASAPAHPLVSWLY